MYKIFIDGKDGTTGLKIYERFKDRRDLEILLIDEDKRKDTAERKRLINAADVVFLCLPDAAAVEAVALCENDHTKIIDASTAHRTAAGWAYGLPELGAEFRSAIATSNRIANPGCYATGAISVIYPLVKLGILPSHYPLTMHGLSGYSGAGKKAIEQYERSDRARELDSPRQYALTLCHKHIPEITKVCGLTRKPILNPIICDYPQGMVVSVPLFADMLTGSYNVESLREAYAKFYSGSNFIKVREPMGADVLDGGFLGANALENSNILELFICGNDEQFTVAARLDNLGKGASGAAVQCMNIALGLDETTGLI